MRVEEGPHHSPTLRWFQVGQRQVGMLDGKEAENVLTGGKCVEGGFGVFERVEVGVHLLTDWGVTPSHLEHSGANHDG